MAASQGGGPFRRSIRWIAQRPVGTSIVFVMVGAAAIGALAFVLPLHYEVDCVPLKKDDAGSVDGCLDVNAQQDDESGSTFRDRLPALDSGSMIWYAGGTWLLAVFSAVTLASVFNTYRRSKRVESARFTKEFYERWFFDSQLAQFRSYLENEDWWELTGDCAPDQAATTDSRSTSTCSHRDPNPLARTGDLDFAGGRGKTCVHDRNKLAVVDAGLNFLELMLKLRDEGTIEVEHSDSFLHYWVDSLMRLPDRHLLRSYIFRWGWPRLQERLMSSEGASYFPYIAFVSASHHGGGAQPGSDSADHDARPNVAPPRPAPLIEYERPATTIRGMYLTKVPWSPRDAHVEKRDERGWFSRISVRLLLRRTE